MSTTGLAGADENAGHIPADPELATLQKQNAVLEEKIKLLTQRQRLETMNGPDPVSKESDLMGQRLKLLSQQQNLAAMSIAPSRMRHLESLAEHKDDTTIESVRMAYTSLAGVAPDVAKQLNCGGKNIVLYGPSQSEALLTARTFTDQLGQLRARLRAVLSIQPPAGPDQPGNTPSVFGVAALSGPVVQSVLDLISLFNGGEAPGAADLPVDESALVAIVANAAAAQGCVVYWPDQYVANPFNPSSQVLAGLAMLAELNDNGGVTGKPAGLQQKINALKLDLRRSDAMSETYAQKLEKERTKLTDAVKKVELLRAEIDFVSGHIKDERNASLQDKLNKTFEKSWQELEAAVKKQVGTGLPGTIEEQGKLGEMSKRLDILKTRTDWLSQYVKDEKDLALQDRLKRTLSNVWDQFEAAVKAQQALAVSVPQAMEPDLREQRRWDKYTSDLKELITTTTAASEAYSTFRTALLDGGSGVSPLSRMLRAEALRDLTFDDKLQERAGASVVQLRLQRLTGTRVTRAGFNEKESFSGGVVLSFVQYEPNGKVKNSGVHTAYAGFHP